MVKLSPESLPHESLILTEGVLMKKIYTYHEDPGHGWLEVPREMLTRLNIADKISEYSYQRGKSVFLEEDGDMGHFFTAYKERYGCDPAYISKYLDVTPIRDYASYQK